ncbi:uncharacterized protein LOC129802666 [Phlebotomus papatasi]|uniref:uncharacterized protein LOC129802666 n=1 Tax=Phlebotomus papatasi TaxID=29031 RepID=UPI0024836B65|nr:uncharacterized protein LOC129802666 [Phlebotomus papatasi]
MPFLVVKTIEDGIPCVAACPDTWVEGSRLYWPKECVNIDKIRSNDKIKPQKSWMKLKCQVKMRDIASFGEAVRYEKALSTVDTESEAEIVEHRKGKQSTCSLGQGTASQDFNFLVSKTEGCNAVYFSESAEGHYETSLANETGPDPTSIKIVECPEPEYFPARAEEDIESGNEAPVEQTLSQCDNCAVFLEELNQIKDNLKYLSLLPAIDVKLDRLLEEQENPKGGIKRKNTPKIDIFPIGDESVLEDFEAHLANKTYREQFVHQMSSFGGTSGNRDGNKIAFRLIDKIFTSDLLTNYSWTGAKTKYIKKQFSTYTHFIEAFYDIVKLADERYSTIENEKFFKEKILKHSLARSKQKKK